MAVLARPLRLAFDRQIFDRQRRGGISRYFGLLSDTLDQDKFQVSARRGLWSGRVSRVYDVIHATYYCGTPYRTDRAQALVSTLHDMSPERCPEFFPFSRFRSPHANKLAWLKQSDLVISVSAASADDLAFHEPSFAGSTTVIHHATSLKLVSPQVLPELVGQPFWLMIGKRSGYKNCAVVYRALSKILRHSLTASSGCHLVLAGGEPIRAWEQRLLADNGLSSSVYYCVPSDSQLVWLYRNALGVLIPSFAEGFSYPLIEALAFDVPVLASDIEVHREVASGFATFLSPSNSESWAECLRQGSLLRPSRMLGREAYSRLVEYYSIPRFIAEHEKAYFSLV
jgi:glycosyltransferase involved in cell wall biosynthesis